MLRNRYIKYCAVEIVNKYIFMSDIKLFVQLCSEDGILGRSELDSVVNLIDCVK